MGGKWGAFFVAVFTAGFWGFFALVLGDVFRFGCVDVYEPFTARVDVWSPDTGAVPAAPLPQAYSSLTPIRLLDGRIVLNATTGEGHLDTFEWDPEAKRFKVAPFPGLPVPPPGVDAGGKRVAFTSFGRVLVDSQSSLSQGDTSWFFDHGWREVQQPPFASRIVDLGDIARAIDLTGGGLVVIGHTMIGAPSAYLLEPGASVWGPAAPLPSLHPEACFSAANGEILLLDEPQPRLWDPRSGAVTPLSMPSPMREASAAVSLDETHVLIAGGHSTSKTLNRGFFILCAIAAVWLALGAFGAYRFFASLKALRDAASVRYAITGLVLVVVAIGALALGVELLAAGAGHVRWVTS